MAEVARRQSTDVRCKCQVKLRHLWLHLNTWGSNYIWSSISLCGVCEAVDKIWTQKPYLTKSYTLSWLIIPDDSVRHRSTAEDFEGVLFMTICNSVGQFCWNTYKAAEVDYDWTGTASVDFLSCLSSRQRTSLDQSRSFLRWYFWSRWFTERSPTISLGILERSYKRYMNEQMNELGN